MNIEFKQPNVILYFILLLGAFPYPKILPIPSDTQPYFILACLVYAFSRTISIPKSNYLIFGGILVLFSFVYFCAYLSLPAARSLVSYLSPVAGGVVVYNLLKSRNGLNALVKLSFWAFWVYVLCGFAQYFTNPEIFDVILNVRTSSSRGVTSLTSEPNYFGAMSFFFFAILHTYGTQTQSNIGFALLCVVNLVLATSAISLLLFLLAVISFFQEKLKVYGWPKYSIPIFTLIALMFLLQSIGSGKLELSPRMYHILTSVAAFDFRLLFIDGSASGRFSSIFMAIYGSLQNFMLPTAPGSYESFYAREIGQFRHIFPFGNPTEQPMTGLGIYIYDFGLLGVAAYYYFARLCLRAFGPKPLFAVGVVFISVFVFPFSHTIYAFVIGLGLVHTNLR